MTQEQLINKLDETNLLHHLENFNSLLRPTIALSLGNDDEDRIRIGSSKIGGKPDLPKSFKWPAEDGHEKKPLSFIAQVNFAEVAHYDTDHLLPERGIIYFFYSAEQEAWGFEIKDKDKFKILYFEGDVTELKRTDFPDGLPNYARYVACNVVTSEEVSLPYFHNEGLSFLTEQEKDRYVDVYDVSTNKLLGYADPIQGDMELECELVTNGLYCGDPSGYNDPRAKMLEPNAKNWQLLLQIDSNEENEMMWGDVGRLYFWIKKEDLKDKQFDNCWCILQCG